MINLYATLEIKSNATPEEIKSAHRRLARALHPDAHGGDKTRSEKFHAVQAAYEILSDEKKRAAYDGLRQEWMDREGLAECPGCAALNRILRRPSPTAEARCARCGTRLPLKLSVQFRATQQSLTLQFADLYDEVGGEMAALAADGIRSGFAYLRQRLGLGSRNKEPRQEGSRGGPPSGKLPRRT